MFAGQGLTVRHNKLNSVFVRSADKKQFENTKAAFIDS